MRASFKKVVRWGDEADPGEADLTLSLVTRHPGQGGKAAVPKRTLRELGAADRC